MPDIVTTEAPATAAPPSPEALRPFTPAPIPKSGYADPTKANRKVPLNFPVVCQGKTWDAIYLRRLTVGQVAVIVDNFVEMNRRDPEVGLAFPIYVDAEENEMPLEVIELLPDEEWQSIMDLGRDCVPQRFRPPPTPEKILDPSPNDSSPSIGDSTEASS